MVSPLPGIRREAVDQDDRSLWRYAATLPVDASSTISLGEGWTPLVDMSWSGVDVLAKIEWAGPTSSFKDRGVAVMMSHLRSLGATRVLEDSSGNGGASVACYAAAAGIDATILVPEATSPAKILQARAFGAAIELVGGSRDDVADEAIRRSADIPYASHNWHPFFLQGVKTLAYEIWEQLDWRAPDNVVLVAGAGSQVLGCDLAFRELLRSGAIEQMPRLLIGQPEDWAALVDAFHGREPDPAHPRRPTLAEGAAIARPVRLPEVVAALRDSGGAATAVSEEEIRDATRRLTAQGLYAEPTSAVAAAALDRFLSDGTIQPGETTVVVLTGSGLKSPDAMRSILG